MPVFYSVHIFCEGCGAPMSQEEYGEDAEVVTKGGLSAMRLRAAKQDGWEVIFGKDFCPVCVVARRNPRGLKIVVREGRRNVG